MVEWLEAAARDAAREVEIELMHPEGAWVGAGEPLAYLDRQPGASVGPGDDPAAEDRSGLRRRAQCLADVPVLPKVAFLAMEARHCAGAEMQDMMGYAASVGSDGGEA